MQALRHLMEGDPEMAREILGQIPEVGEDDLLLRQIELGGQTLSDLARQERGNRAQRRAAARGQVAR